jgi:hypothetical protein
VGSAAAVTVRSLDTLATPAVAATASRFRRRNANRHRADNGVLGHDAGSRLGKCPGDLWHGVAIGHPRDDLQRASPLADLLLEAAVQVCWATVRVSEALRPPRHPGRNQADATISRAAVRCGALPFLVRATMIPVVISVLQLMSL